MKNNSKTKPSDSSVTCAVNVMTESADRYNFCLQGSPQEIVEQVCKEMGEEIEWISEVSVKTLPSSEKIEEELSSLILQKSKIN